MDILTNLVLNIIVTSSRNVFFKLYIRIIIYKVMCVPVERVKVNVTPTTDRKGPRGFRVS
jgi:hypothetical protein